MYKTQTITPKIFQLTQIGKEKVKLEYLHKLNMHIVLIKNEKKMGHSQKHIWDWTYTNTIFGGYFINLSLHSWYNPKLGLFIVLK